jgi:phage-related protein
MDAFPFDKYSPNTNASTEKPEMRVNVAQFGDGYRQTAIDGINADVSTVDVAWNNVTAQAKDEIYSFLKTRFKRDPFLFRMPDWPQAEIVYCTAITKTYVNKYMWSVTATLQRAAYLGGLA